MLRVDYDRWGQTPEDLRQLATSAAHQRTRERFLALYEVTQASYATQVGADAGQPHMLGVVALANKMARTIWALTVRGEVYGSRPWRPDQPPGSGVPGSAGRAEKR